MRMVQHGRLKDRPRLQEQTDQEGGDQSKRRSDGGAPPPCQREEHDNNCKAAGDDEQRVKKAKLLQAIRGAHGAAPVYSSPCFRRNNINDVPALTVPF